MIELREIVLAPYMQRPQIVRSSGHFRLDLLENEWWGEPLNAMFGRIMVEDLTQRLPGSVVFSEHSAVEARADTTVGINIQSLDDDRTGAVALTAQIAIVGRGAEMRSVRLTAPAASLDTSGFVSATSAATAKLADTVAAMLQVSPNTTTADETEIRHLRRSLARAQKEGKIMKQIIYNLTNRVK